MGGALRHLYAEAQAIQILADSISHATISPLARSGHAGRRQTAMLGRAKDFIHAQTDAELSVAAIAQEAGVSVSGLQTLFRQHEGCGVSEYVRRTRLDRAHHGLLHDGISIDAATRLAGYAHAANFATAFRKRFHVSPRSVGRG
ncbi:MAG: hypothetical protein DI498_00650 [Paracoccus denitrificans]|nr:MAG: hypothetical protein DI498_00650 [Paracoccus denitrificans]PZO86276.1 MAG: hypothetical protein DI633_00650 [Paracoccus denitrificans]